MDKLEEGVTVDAPAEQEADAAELQQPNEGDNTEASEETEARSDGADDGTEQDSDPNDDAADDGGKETRNQRRRRREKEERERQERRAKEREAEIARLKSENERLKAEGSELKRPDPTDFDTDADYIAALAAYQVRTQTAEGDQKRRDNEIKRLNEEAQDDMVRRAKEQREIALKQYSDFDQKLEVARVALGDKVNPAIDAMLASNQGADFAYYLGCNPEQARDLSQMNPIQAAMEIGRIAAGLSKPKPKTTTSAPPPITPVKGKNTTIGDPNALSMEDYIKARDAGQLR